MTAFPDLLRQTASEVERAMDAVLPQSGLMAAPMRYAALSGGKRLRAFLVVQGADLFDVPRAQSLRAAAAIECIHAYSLIHDDLPCMDDDDLRRGQPTVHRKWDEATAVLAGDALQALSFEILADPATASDPLIRSNLCLRLARAAGGAGMVLGQALDIAAETAQAELGLDDIQALQRLKTGALFEWSAMAGAVLGGADPAPLSFYAANLGEAFQIWDDVLDVEGDADKAGKKLQKDAEAGKATFVSLLGLQSAKDRARSKIEAAIDALAPYGAAALPLKDAARFVIAREM